jgi:type IV pilus assembly protein PilM
VPLSLPISLPKRAARGSATKDFFALDIGSSAVKALQLRPLTADGPRNQDAGWAIVGLDHGLVSRAMIVERRIQLPQQEALAAVISDTITRAQIGSRTAAVALPTVQAASRIVAIPAGMNIPEEEAYVEGEVERAFSVNLDDVQWDFDVLGPVHPLEVGDRGVEEEEVPRVHALITISKKDVFLERQDVVAGSAAMADHRVRVAIADVETFAIERAMADLIRRTPSKNRDMFPNPPLQEDPDHPGRMVLDSNVLAHLRDQTGDVHLTAEQGPVEVLIELGHESSTLYAMYGNRVVYSHESDHGMRHLIDDLARQWGMSVQDTQTALIGQSIPESQAKVWASDLLPRVRTDVGNQVHRLIQNFFAAMSINRIHRIWLGGGGATLEGLAKEVEESTGVTTLIANPLDGLTRDRSGRDRSGKQKEADDAYVRMYGPMFLQAYGLAIRDVPIY